MNVVTYVCGIPLAVVVELSKVIAEITNSPESSRQLGKFIHAHVEAGTRYPVLSQIDQKLSYTASQVLGSFCFAKATIKTAIEHLLPAMKGSLGHLCMVIFNTANSHSYAYDLYETIKKVGNLESKWIENVMQKSEGFCHLLGAFWDRTVIIQMRLDTDGEVRQSHLESLTIILRVLYGVECLAKSFFHKELPKQWSYYLKAMHFALSVIKKIHADSYDCRLRDYHERDAFKSFFGE